MLFLFVGSVI